MWELSAANKYSLMKVDQSDGTSVELTTFQTDNGISLDSLECDSYAGKCYIHKNYNGTSSDLHVYDLSNNSWSVAKRSTAHLGDSDKFTWGITAYPHFGKNLIRKENDGSVHIGENSLVTQEVGGVQQLYATNSLGNQIDLNIKSGTNLLIGGVNIMEAIHSSVAMGSAMASLPTSSGDAKYTCGLGTGFHNSTTAISGGCGLDFKNFDIIDLMPKAFQKASFNFGVASVLDGEDDGTSLKAGITFKFGTPKKIKTAEAIQFRTENKIDAVMQENKILKDQIAAINLKLETLNMVASN
jgi:hypothetical protein